MNTDLRIIEVVGTPYTYEVYRVAPDPYDRGTVVTVCATREDAERYIRDVLKAN